MFHSSKLHVPPSGVLCLCSFTRGRRGTYWTRRRKRKRLCYWRWWVWTWQILFSLNRFLFCFNGISSVVRNSWSASRVKENRTLKNMQRESVSKTITFNFCIKWFTERSLLLDFKSGVWEQMWRKRKSFLSSGILGNLYYWSEFINQSVFVLCSPVCKLSFFDRKRQ